MRSRKRRASSSCRVSISHSRSRPTRMPRTRPASSRTFKCFVIACRVTAAPALSRAVDNGPPAHRRATRCKRVSSPRAAKIGAEPWSSPPRVAARAVLATCTGLAITPSGRRGQMRCDLLHLHFPTSLVAAVSLAAARGGNPIEAGFGDLEQSAAGRRLQLEDHESRGLGGIVPLRLDRVRVPTPGKNPLRLPPLDPGGHDDVLVNRVGY